MPIEIGSPTLPGIGTAPGLARGADLAVGGVRDLGEAALGRVHALSGPTEATAAEGAVRAADAPTGDELRAAAQTVRAEAQAAAGTAREAGQAAGREARELAQGGRDEARGPAVRGAAETVVAERGATPATTRGEAGTTPQLARAGGEIARAEGRDTAQIARTSGDVARIEARDTAQIARTGGDIARAEARGGAAGVRDLAQAVRDTATGAAQVARATAADTAQAARSAAAELRGAAEAARDVRGGFADASRRGAPDTLGPTGARAGDTLASAGRPGRDGVEALAVRGSAANAESRLPPGAGRAEGQAIARPGERGGEPSFARMVDAAGRALSPEAMRALRDAAVAAAALSAPPGKQAGTLSDARLAAPGPAAPGLEAPGRLLAGLAAAVAAEALLPVRDAPGGTVQAIGREAAGREGLERALALALAAQAGAAADIDVPADLAAALRRLPGEAVVYRDPWTGEPIVLTESVTEEDRVAQVAAADRDDYGVSFFGPANRADYRPGLAALAGEAAAALLPAPAVAPALGWDGVALPFAGAFVFRHEADGAWVPQRRL